MEKIYELEKAQELLESASLTFIDFLKDAMFISKTDEIKFVGIGNSISAGWTATNDNVTPWIEKLKPFLEDKCKKEGVDIDFGAFTLASDNSNQQIYKFLLEDPTKHDVKEHFMQTFDSWKIEFDGTLFENLVDRTTCLECYSDSDRRLTDYFGKNKFTITSFNGCMGELIDSPKDLFTPHGLSKIIDKELLYLERIISLIVALSENSYITVGNFPEITKKYLFMLNIIIRKINEKIKMTTYKVDKAFYFRGINMDLIDRIDGKLKLDNHPNLRRQCLSLYNYVIFLMRYLSGYLAASYETDKFQKYLLLNPKTNRKH